MRTATTMLQRTPKAAMRPRSPTTRPSPPKNSAQIARNASGAGMAMCWVNMAIVTWKPPPPNQPGIFWAPWAKNTTPRTSRRIVRTGSFVVSMSLRSMDISPFSFLSDYLTTRHAPSPLMYPKGNKGEGWGGGAQNGFHPPPRPLPSREGEVYALYHSRTDTQPMPAAQAGDRKDRIRPRTPGEDFNSLFLRLRMV